MAKDIKEIFAMDTSTLEELRLKISELKNALKEYTIGSEEYLKINGELQTEQKKLKAAMHTVKEEVDLDGKSFNELNIQLASLKEAWKAAADEAKRGELTAQINEVKARINGMNESIGNFQHNVGNYTNSIVDAFGKMGISVTSLTAPLKKVGVDIEDMDTSIKILAGTFKTFSGQNLAALKEGFSGITSSIGTFVKGLSGIKAAILGTGLGALLVLIGELIAHWDDLTGAVDRWIAKTNEGVTTADALRAELEQENNEINFQLNLMRALHKSEQDITEMNILLKQQEIEKAEAVKAQNLELAQNARWHWTRVAAIKGADAAEEELKKLNKELNDLLDKQAIQMYAAANATDENTKATKSNAAAKQQLKEVQLDLNVSIGETEREAADAEKEVLDGLQKALDLQQAEIDKRKTAMELEMEDYEQKKALLEEYHLSTEELTANHEEKMADLRAEVEQAEYEELLRQRDAEKAIDEERKKEYEKLMKARQTATANMASGTVGILKQMSKAMGDSTKLGKGFAIAAATIDTIASAVTGFRAGMNQWADAGPMAWMAPVQAALNATMALTAGFAEIQQIRNVDTSGSSTGGATGGAVALAIPNIEGLSSPVDYTRQVTTETEKEEMNQNNRVYILESDIQQSNNRVRVREEETTF